MSTDRLFKPVFVRCLQSMEMFAARLLLIMTVLNVSHTLTHCGKVVIKKKKIIKTTQSLRGGYFGYE